MKTKQEIIVCTLLALLNLTSSALQPHQQLPHDSSLQAVKQWKLLSYNFLPHAPVKDTNFYNPMNILITGIAITDDRIFIATPKLFSGVSSTVNYVPKVGFGDSPELQAYPDWSYSTTARTDFNCSDMVLVSVYRMRIDSCNRLWALDAGITASLEDFEKTCPPKILVFDLNTDQVVRRIDFPTEILRGESLFTNLIIDETTSSHNCDDVFIYIADTVEPGIIVYDSAKDVTWRLSHPSMYPDPDFAESKILNDRFVLMDGIVGLTFDAKSGLVYFQPLATDRIFSIHKDKLRAGPLAYNEILDVKLVGKKSSQGIGIAVSPIDDSLIFSPMTETAVALWNPHTNKQSVLAADRDQLQFIADMTFARHKNDYVYVISSKFHRFFLKNLNPNEINNRILRIKLPNSTPLSSNHLFGYQYEHPKYEFAQHTNSLDRPYKYFDIPTTQLSGSIFDKQPYSFEPVVINYGAHNPFTALNQGESISSLHRSKSYLDRLSETPTRKRNEQSPWAPYIPRGYFYKRDIRSKREETA